MLNVSWLMSFSLEFFLQILIYYDDAERKGSRGTDPHQGSLQCCIVGKVMSPADFSLRTFVCRLLSWIISPKILIVCIKDSLKFTGNVHCTLIHFILRNYCLIFKLFKRKIRWRCFISVGGKTKEATLKHWREIEPLTDTKTFNAGNWLLLPFCFSKLSLWWIWV